MSRALLLLLLAGCTSGHDPGADWMPHAELSSDPALTALPDREVPPPTPLRTPGDGPDVTVYGYWPYWGDPLDTVQWDQLTHLAVFNVDLAPDGSLDDTSRWLTAGPQAVSLAAPWGVRVHLTLTCFSDTVMASVLPDPAKRARTIDGLVDLVDQVGAHGVNIDFEGVDAVHRATFLTFIQELRPRVDDLYIAMPAIDWTDAFDEPALAASSDGLFLMGYGYHWSGGNPGPVAPLDGGGIWSDRSLSDTVADYRALGVPDDKLILGLPLYGREWPTTGPQVPGTRTGNGVAVFYTDAVASGLSAGRQWDAQTSTPWALPTSTRQLWYDDATSLEAKAGWAISEGLQGVGFWALTYDDADPVLWTAMDALTHTDVPLTLDAFVPGRVREVNTLSFTGARPHAEVTLAVGTRPGAPTIPGCSETLDFRDPFVLGSVTADAQGAGTLYVFAPPTARRRPVLAQAVDLGACDVSPVSTTVFR